MLSSPIQSMMASRTNSATSSRLNLISFNCEGFRANWHAIHHLLVSCASDIVVLQETWLPTSRLFTINDLAISCGFICLCSSAMDECMRTGMLRGRGFGGLAILLRAQVASDVIRVTPTSSTRVLGCTARVLDSSLAIFSVYLPWNSSHSADALVEYLDCLSQLSVAFDSLPLGTRIIVAGDWNCDFVRGDTICADVISISENHNLHFADLQILNRDTATYLNSNGRSSWLDHIAVSNCPELSVASCCILIPPGSRSMHRPVQTSICICTFVHAPCAEVKDRPSLAESSSPIPNWAAAEPVHLEHFQRLVSEGLRSLRTPLQRSISSDLNFDIQTFVSLLIKSAAIAIPPMHSRRAAGATWWSAELQNLKRKCMLWRSIWLDCGKPGSGHVYHSFRASKYKYKYACRKSRTDKEHSDWECAINYKSQPYKFWKKVRQMRGGTSPQLDSQNLSACTADVFADKFQEACTPWNEHTSAAASASVEQRLIGLPQEVDPFTADEVRAAITNRMKMGKAADRLGLRGEHFRLGGIVASEYLAGLLTELVQSRTVPVALQTSVFIPLLKGSHLNASDPANYRGIAIAPMMHRLVEALLLNRWEHQLDTSSSQFAYKKGGSCGVCTHQLLDTVRHYRARHSSVSIVFLDTSKAFDKLVPGVLCDKLLNRGVAAAEVAWMLHALSSSVGQVHLNGSWSAPFNLSSGVRQGSLMGGSLWAVYVDQLLDDLSAAHVGCSVDGQARSVFCYADDIVLVAPTQSGLQRLIALCEAYGCTHQIAFNAKKTVLIHVRSTKSTSFIQSRQILVQGEPITPSFSVFYLGFQLFIDHRSQLVVGVRKALESLFRSANSVIAIPSCNRPCLRLRLVAAFALPCVDYVWQLADHIHLNARRTLCSAVLRVLRRSLLLHSRCNSLLACTVARIFPPRIRAGQLAVLSPATENQSTGDPLTDFVIALRLGGVPSVTAAQISLALDLSEGLVSRAAAIRSLLSSPDRFARQMAFNISVPSALQ